MLGLKLNHVSKRGHWAVWLKFCWQHFQMHFLSWKLCILIKISLPFVPQDLIGDTSAFVWAMVWRRTIDKPLAELMMTQFTEVYVSPVPIRYCGIDMWCGHVRFERLSFERSSYWWPSANLALGHRHPCWLTMSHTWLNAMGSPDCSWCASFIWRQIMMVADAPAPNKHRSKQVLYESYYTKYIPRYRH